MSKTHSELHRLILMTELEADVDIISKLEEDLGSPHRKTKILRNPAIASHSELVIFSKHLQLEPTLLLNEYGLGTTGLHPYEKELYPAVAAA